MRPETNELLTLEQTRAILGVGRTTLYRMIAEGSIHPIPGNPMKRMQQRFFLRRDIERLMREGRKPTSQHRKAS